MQKYTTSIEIGSDEQKEEIKEPVQKKGPHKKKHVKKSKTIGEYIISFITFLFGVAIICIIASILIFKFCVLQSVECIGVVNADEEEITKTIVNDLEISNTVYAFGKSIVRKHKKIPFVTEYSISLKDKNTIVISVKEDDLLGVFLVGEDLVYFDSNGIVNEISKKYIEGVTNVSGINLSHATDTKELEISATEKNAILKILKSLEKYDLVPTDFVFDEDGTYGVMFDNIFVDLGMTSDVVDKCERLSIIMPTISGSSGTLHFEEWGRDNSDIIFEKTE